MIQDVDETLKRLLAGELPKIAGSPLQGTARINFEWPDNEELQAETLPGINLYLHDVQENLSLRNAGLETIKAGDPAARIGMQSKGRRQAPLWMDLSYVVTVTGAREKSVEHRLLTDVMRVFMRTAAIPDQYLTGELGMDKSLAPRVAVAQPDHPVHADGPALWQALGVRIRPALGLTVTVPFNPSETKWTRVVREAVMALGSGVPPEGPGRPLDLLTVRVSSAGVVLDQARQTPLSGVTVRVVGQEEVATTDERGFFSLLNLPSGSSTLHFEHRGYRSEERATVVPPLGRADQLELLEITLSPQTDQERAEAAARREVGLRATEPLHDTARTLHLSLTGRLVLAGGSPAAYIPVRVGQHHTTTDADGVYCFFGLSPDEQTIHAELPGIGECEVPAAMHGSQA